MSPKTPERHVAARIDHDHVALLHLVEHVAVELRLGIGVLALAEEVRPLRQELQRQRRTDDRLALGTAPPGRPCAGCGSPCGRACRQRLRCRCP